MEKGKRDIQQEFLAEIGRNIKAIRKSKKMTMEDLGLECGLNKAKIHRIEAGYNITLTTILKLSIALNIQPGEIFKTKFDYSTNDLDKLVSNNRNSKIGK